MDTSHCLYKVTQIRPVLSEMPSKSGGSLHSIIFRHYAFKLGSFYAAPCVRNDLGTLPLRMRQLFDNAVLHHAIWSHDSAACNKVVAMDGMYRSVKDVFNVGIASELQD